MAFISTLLINQQAWIRLVGGAFLVYLGTRTLRSQPKEKDALSGSRSLLRDYASTFALTLSNPLTIISFAAIFAGLGLADTGGDYTAAVALVSGVFSGSTLWWVILSVGVSSFRARLRLGGMVWVNRISGTILIALGLIAVLSLVV